jgi:hypothetical protein
MSLLNLGTTVIPSNESFLCKKTDDENDDDDSDDDGYGSNFELSLVRFTWSNMCPVVSRIELFWVCLRGWCYLGFAFDFCCKRHSEVSVRRRIQKV